MSRDIVLSQMPVSETVPLDQRLKSLNLNTNFAPFAAIIAVLVFAWLCQTIRQLSGTTLFAPAVWATVSFLLLAAFAYLGPGLTAPFESKLRFGLVTFTFTPMMAILGAKRPQDRGWQFIVATMWLVLLLPMGQSLIYAPRGAFVLHGAWRLFITLLVLMGLGNYVATRFWPSLLFYVLGQLLLLEPNTAFVPDLSLPHASSWAVLSFSVSAVLIITGFPRRTIAAESLDQVWFDFRDAFGVAWALRINERINQLASQESWNLRLTWHGFVKTKDEYDSSQLELSLRTLMRRFVNTPWIEQRLGVQVVSNTTIPSDTGT